MGIFYLVVLILIAPNRICLEILEESDRHDIMARGPSLCRRLKEQGNGGWSYDAIFSGT